jgi:hypothetical protein
VGVNKVIFEAVHRLKQENNMSKQLGQLYRVSQGTRLWRYIDSSRCHSAGTVLRCGYECVCAVLCMNLRMYR